ncbi:hypothetical protein Tco_1050856 [Tanacetum coccineum]
MLAKLLIRLKPIAMNPVKLLASHRLVASSVNTKTASSVAASSVNTKTANSVAAMWPWEGLDSCFCGSFGFLIRGMYHKEGFQIVKGKCLGRARNDKRNREWCKMTLLGPLNALL